MTESTGLVIGLVIALLALVGTVVGNVYSIRSLREAKRIAKLSGWYKAPEVSLYYGMFPLNQKDSKVLEVAYGMPQNFPRKYVGMLPILVSNAGKRAAENVKLEIVIPAGANAGGELLTFHATRGLLPGFERECFRIGDLLHVYYHIPIINPGKSISVEEPFWLEKTVDAHMSASVPTADKQMVHFEATYSFSFNFRLILDHKEELPFLANISLSVVEEDGVEKLSQRLIKISEERDGDPPGEVEDIRQLVKRLERKHLLLVLPAFNEIKATRKDSVHFEDVNKSQRWELSRHKGRWELHKQVWKLG